MFLVSRFVLFCFVLFIGYFGGFVFVLFCFVLFWFLWRKGCSIDAVAVIV